MSDARWVTGSMLSVDGAFTGAHSIRPSVAPCFLQGGG
jgi:hypothetical protein